MANASAKKAAAARASTAKFYQPFLIAINVAYIVLRWFWDSWSVSFGEAVLLIAMAGMQVYSYVGIIDSSATQSTKDKSLAGGAALDLLGLVLVVEFGSLLISRKFYWLLAGVPVWGAYSLYTVFGGGGGGKKAAAAATGPDEGNGAGGDKQADARREKRAERRRNKWT